MIKIFDSCRDYEILINYGYKGCFLFLGETMGEVCLQNVYPRKGIVRFEFRPLRRSGRIQQNTADVTKDVTILAWRSPYTTYQRRAEPHLSG